MTGRLLSCAGSTPHASASHRGVPRGGALMESLVALLLSAGLLILMAGLLVQYSRGTRLVAGRTEGTESARIARDLISSALAADPDASVGADGLSVRTFVGFAERCGEDVWRYRGRRLPDPARDSLWVVRRSGRVELALLVGRGDGACEGERVDPGLTLSTDPGLLADVRLVRVFESGRYRVDDAVRYGRTGRGAQPLSAAVLDRSRSGLSPSGGGVVVTVVPQGRPDGYVGRWGR